MAFSEIKEVLQLSHLAKNEIVSIKTEINGQNNRLINIQKMNSCLKDLLGTNDKNIIEIQKKKQYGILMGIFFFMILFLLIIFVKIIFF